MKIHGHGYYCNLPAWKTGIPITHLLASAPASLSMVDVRIREHVTNWNNWSVIVTVEKPICYFICATDNAMTKSRPYFQHMRALPRRNIPPQLLRFFVATSWYIFFFVFYKREIKTERARGQDPKIRSQLEVVEPFFFCSLSFMKQQQS